MARSTYLVSSLEHNDPGNWNSSKEWELTASQLALSLLLSVLLFLPPCSTEIFLWSITIVLLPHNLRPPRVQYGWPGPSVSGPFNFNPLTFFDIKSGFKLPRERRWLIHHNMKATRDQVQGILLRNLSNPVFLEVWSADRLLVYIPQPWVFPLRYVSLGHKGNQARDCQGSL